jgi:fluoride exporter
MPSSETPEPPDRPMPGHRDRFPGFPVDPDVTREADLPPPRIHRTVVGAVALGGSLGALARWALAEALPHDAGQFPWATFLTNVLGCLLIGVLMVLMVLVVERWPAQRLVRPFVGTGVLGGFTTFSTYVVDTRSLVAADHAGLAAGYLFGTLVVGLLAVAAGLRVTESVVR